MKKVILAGGTGFIGTYFEKRLKEMGFEVLIISRQGRISWKDKQAIIEALENAELVVNLAGKSVNCRYNEKNKEEIMQSRITTTNILGECIEACDNPPKAWMNSSTATIYRHAEDRPMTEENGEIGSGFSVDVATTWENEFFKFKLPDTRQIALRTAIVLGKEDGGVMTPYRNLVRFGLGGVQGNGKQMFSWIHIEDLFQIVLFLNEKTDLEGVFNCSAPNPVTNQEFMKAIREQMGKTFGLPSPKWMLELGAIMIRTETELVLKSRWVIPEKLTKAGYQFTFPAINETLQNIL